MRINPECLRDLLISIESSCDLDNSFFYEKTNRPPDITKHLHEPIVYHAIQCNDAGLFKGFTINDDLSCFYVDDLTPKGHALIAELRDNTIWNKLLHHGVNSVPDIITFIIDALKTRL